MSDSATPVSFNVLSPGQRRVVDAFSAATPNLPLEVAAECLGFHVGTVRRHPNGCSRQQSGCVRALAQYSGSIAYGSSSVG